MKTPLTLLFALCIAITANAQVAPLDVQLNHLHLHWALGEGLTITCDGRAMLGGQPGPVCAYPTGWTWSYMPTPAEKMSAKLTTQGQRKVMTIECKDLKLQWRSVVTAGPGDRFTIAYTYTQDAWDKDINSEDNLCLPAVSWLVGATWKATSDAGTTTSGQIPLAFGGVSNPFGGAKQAEFTSLFGKLTITSTRGLTLYDYKDRKQFWLGRDEPFPRTVEQSWSADLAYEPAPFTVAGVKVSDLRSPEGLGAERAEMSLGLARTVEGPAKITARLVADLPAPAPVDEHEVTLSEKPSAVKLSVPLPGPGHYTIHLELLADGKPIYQSPPLSAVVPQLLSLAPARVPFMTGDKASVVVRVDPAAGDNLRVAIMSGTTQLAEGPVTAGHRAVLPIALTSLPAGRSQLTAALLRGSDRLSRATSDVIVAEFKANAVVIDNLSHTMIVRGMPFCPQSCYCIGDTVPGIVETEAPLGFNVIAPYYDDDIPARKLLREQTRKLLDRCAQVGMYVNLDIRRASHPPQTADTWQWLKDEIEAFRDHPALLSYYLADEPEGGWASPEECLTAYRKIKDLDPYHPITIVHCVPSAAAAYSPAEDIVMTDPYPIPGGPVTAVVDYIERIRKDTGDRLPMWVVPQAFGGGEGWSREPSRQEERVMTYLGLIHGARGVQYFIRRPPLANPSSPDLWSECRRLMLELSQLTPALCSDEEAPKVTCAQPEVHVAAFKERGAVTILAANTENRPMPLDITLDVPFDGPAEVVFENRRVAVSKGKLVDMIDAMSTRVYRVQVDPAPVGPAKIDPRNLTSNPSFEEAANVGTPDGAYTGVGADKAASWFVDPRTAAHGRQSLRLRNPVEGQGISVAPYPVGLTPGKRYRLSIWAKGERPGMKFRLGLDAVSDPQAVHEMTTEWKEYAVDFTASANATRMSPGLNLVSQGSAWFDALQVVPLD